jgi:putative phosphoribosyl transferase
MNPFSDRREAGRELAQRLTEYANRTDVVVLAVPRGGVPVAFEVAKALSAPLDVLLVNEVYSFGREDIHVATIASRGYAIIEARTIEGREVDPATMQRELERAHREIGRQERTYVGDRAPTPLHGQTIVVICDGIVTGSSMQVAISAVRARGAARVIVAAPVVTPNAYAELATVADACVAVAAPDPFYRIAMWYDDFAPVTDASVAFFLERAALTRSAAAA